MNPYNLSSLQVAHNPKHHHAFLEFMTVWALKSQHFFLTPFMGTVPPLLWNTWESPNPGTEHSRAAPAAFSEQGQWPTSWQTGVGNLVLGCCKGSTKATVTTLELQTGFGQKQLGPCGAKHQGVLLHHLGRADCEGACWTCANCRAESYKTWSRSSPKGPLWFYTFPLSFLLACKPASHCTILGAPEELAASENSFNALTNPTQARLSLWAQPNTAGTSPPCSLPHHQPLGASLCHPELVRGKRIYSESKLQKSHYHNSWKTWDLLNLFLFSSQEGDGQQSLEHQQLPHVLHVVVAHPHVSLLFWFCFLPLQNYFEAETNIRTL